jgi:hypothetical protein
MGFEYSLYLIKQENKEYLIQINKEILNLTAAGRNSGIPELLLAHASWVFCEAKKAPKKITALPAWKIFRVCVY